MAKNINIIINSVLMRVIDNCKSLLALKLMRIVSPVVLFAMIAVCNSTSMAQSSFSQEETTKLDCYAQILGQASACNIDCEDELNKIVDWLKKRMDAGYPDRLFKFIDDSAMHNYAQKDHPILTCNEVSKIFIATDFSLP